MAVVLGYHGCDTETARNLVDGSPFKPSDKRWDWLGSGAYFWEWDALRAYQWANEHRHGWPSVVGAAIELGNCLDLTSQTGILAVERAYRSYVVYQESRREPILRNKEIKGRDSGDLPLRLLDRAVITHLHEGLRRAGVNEYDTVRALFPEGEELYPSAGFWKKTHVQITVRNLEQIRGVFRVPEHDLRKLHIPANIYDLS